MPAGGCVNGWGAVRIGVGWAIVAFVWAALPARSPKGPSSEVSAPLTTAQVRTQSATRIRTIANAAMTLTSGERGVDTGVCSDAGVGADGPGSPAGWTSASMRSP